AERSGFGLNALLGAPHRCARSELLDASRSELRPRLRVLRDHAAKRVEYVGPAQAWPSDQHVESPGNQPVRTGQRLPAAEVCDGGVAQNTQQDPAEPCPEAGAPQYVLEVANFRVCQSHFTPPCGAVVRLTPELSRTAKRFRLERTVRGREPDELACYARYSPDYRGLEHA